MWGFMRKNTLAGYMAGVLLCILMLALIPVSYTHLDVYKRQIKTEGIYRWQKVFHQD